MSLAVMATAAAGLFILALCGLSFRRVPPGARPAVAAMAFAYALWTAGCIGLLLGLPQGYFWGGVRPVAFVAIAIALGSSPGVKRSPAEWLDVLLDGTITTCGIFATLWFVVHVQSFVGLGGHPGWLLLWLAFQFVLMIPVVGLLNRSVPGARLAPLASLLVAVLVLAGDMFALLSGRPELAIPLWLGGGIVVALALVAVGGLFFDNTFDDPMRPRQILWWQLPVVPVLLYALDPSQADAVVIGLGFLLFATMCLHLVRHSARNEGLWDSLSTRSRLYRDVLRDSQDVIMMLGPEYRIEYANEASAGVLGTAPESLTGHVISEFVVAEDDVRVRELILGFDFAGGAVLRFESRFTGDDDVPRTIEWAVSQRAETTGLALSGRDVSERNRLQCDLLTAARTDALTGLLNRASFLTEADERLDAGAGAAVMFIDLDQFKPVNDTMGHATGDLMLRRAAQWLEQAAGPDDLVARLGSDEFAILTGGDPDQAMERAQSVVSAFSGFDPDPGGRPAVSVSIGVVVARSGRGADLLRDADLAMHRAKQRGGAGVVRFEPWMSERVLERSRLLTELESAIQHGGLVLHLQPVVTLPGGQWTGFEALVRWPVGSRLRPPDEFLPLAQESGLIVPLGTWVLNEALRQLGTFADRTLGLAVNVSAQQLAAPGFGAIVLAALRNNGIEFDRLTLEITEQTAIQDLGRTASRLQDLRAEGIRTAIDDFGTGFSSMQYLARLPVDTLKIDRKFVWGLGEQGEHDVLVRSMIRLAAEMGFDVIAEGVETQSQADLLAGYGCRLAQGYLFSRPLPMDELKAQIAAGGAQLEGPDGLIPGPRRALKGETAQLVRSEADPG